MWGMCLYIPGGTWSRSPFRAPPPCLEGAGEGRAAREYISPAAPPDLVEIAEKYGLGIWSPVFFSFGFWLTEMSSLRDTSLEVECQHHVYSVNFTLLVYLNIIAVPRVPSLDSSSSAAPPPACHVMPLDARMNPGDRR